MLEYYTPEKLLKLGYKQGDKNYFYKNTLMGIDIIARCSSCGRWNTTATKIKKGEMKVVCVCECCEARTMIDLDKRKLKLLSPEKGGL